MPKIIPELGKTIRETARTVLMREGYHALSMRVLAKQCGIAVGTLYNHYGGKEELAAAVTMEDWQRVLREMDAFAETRHGLMEGLTGLCTLLASFTGQYRQVWTQYGPGGRAAGYTAKYHKTLREQLARPIEAVLRGAGRESLLPLSGVLAEAMLSCALDEELGVEKFGLLASTWEPLEY